MDLSSFGPAAPGDLVPITGTDPVRGPWTHSAFVPYPLRADSPTLSAKTYLAVGNARAALAALDSTANQLPNPRLLRRTTLQTEAQSTSALEGTYAPLAEILVADEERPQSPNLQEVLNYVAVGSAAFEALEKGRNLTVGLLEELQAILVRRTSTENASSGSIRDIQVIIGRRSDALDTDLAVTAARFVPSPPGRDFRAKVQDLLDWMSTSHALEIDPVVAAAMAHYQFETLHAFHDGNGRIGRLLIVVHLLKLRVLSEPTLTVSPWFEARRSEYHDRLLAVSTDADWDSFVRFFATGLEASALTTRDRMLDLVGVQNELKEIVRGSTLRADTAQTLVDYAVAHTSFTVRAVERDLGISYGRANSLIGQLVALGVLASLPNSDNYRRIFYAPEVMRVLINRRDPRSEIHR